jgi:acyl carrier protein
MQRTEITEQVQRVICDQLDVAKESVTEEASIIDDLGADSLAVVELVLALEEQFGVTIPDSETDKIRTVGDVVTYIEQHAGGLAAAS